MIDISDIFPDDMNDPVCTECPYKKAGRKCPAVARPKDETFDVFLDCRNDNIRPPRRIEGINAARFLLEAMRDISQQNSSPPSRLLV